MDAGRRSSDLAPRERLDLARYLGTPATIPGLLTRLSFAAPDRSKIDARADASIEDAAARYLAACKPK